MSYDILVFDPAHAPKEREAFLQWWDAQAEWSEPHPYNDPAFTTPSLRAWFMEMIERFPPLGGPYAALRDQRAAGYSIGYHVIYVAISSDKQATHERAYELAGKHRLGFFEASSPDGEIWLPGDGDELVLASKHDEQRRLQNLQPITDPRIIALVKSHPPGGAIINEVCYAENPRRQVNVVYGRDHIAAMMDRLAHKAQSLAQLEKALAEAGIVYAVVEDDEIRTFTGQFADALRYPHLLLPRSNPTDESAP
jgi:hypothetical protein